MHHDRRYTLIVNQFVLNLVAEFLLGSMPEYLCLVLLTL